MAKRTPTLELTPQMIEKDGKRQFAVIPYDQFIALQERLRDAEDLLELRRAVAAEGDAPTVPISQVMKRYGLTGRPRARKS